MARTAHARAFQRFLPAGQLVYGMDEEESEGVIVVRSGRLRCFSSFEGKELTLFMLDAGEAVLFHDASMFEVKWDCELVVIGMSALRRICQTDPELSLALLPAVDRLLQRSIRMIEDMAFHGVKHRLIRALCDTAEREGRFEGRSIVLDRPPNAEDFAMQIGATRQTVSTVMAELVRSGILHRFGGSSMVISDMPRLRQELSGVR
ncbi:Crp/Fnr family transcriptional regulator [Oryzibacter oryziterrae]|uniref:Crp/Fnr family transcriptional regulator n=1 Tax=Oryzibacter oryziterrae TaxID=2766474 RepID=UPI001F32DB7F|nr:Crp/Fnr family transcriptional regulator [Oryzibacter oryziterrae]